MNQEEIAQMKADLASANARAEASDVRARELGTFQQRAANLTVEANDLKAEKVRLEWELQDAKRQGAEASSRAADLDASAQQSAGKLKAADQLTEALQTLLG